MIDFTKPVQTRDGRPVRILCTDVYLESGDSIAGIVDGQLLAWRNTGKYMDSLPTRHDLVQTKEKRVGWINIYPHAHVSNAHPSQERADAKARPDRVACVKVEWEE